MNLSIIIPCKNEEQYIGKLLKSLVFQTYKDFNIIISDANSTDDTLLVVKMYEQYLDIKIIQGGLPSIGRNNGAKATNSDILLFIDSDITLKPDMIEKSIKMFQKKKLHLLTTYIKCENNKSDSLFKINNIIQWLSKYYKPFATGMYFMIDRNVFNQLGGFNENSTYAEDFELSSKIKCSKFSNLRDCVYTDNRRFKKMGYWKICKMFINVFLSDLLTPYEIKNTIYQKDNGYWK